MLQLRNLNTQLSELKSTFDESILQGNSFAEVKKIYTQIKEIEKLIAARQLELLNNNKVENSSN